MIFSTGNEVTSETDFTSVGEMGLSLTRTYNYFWNGIGLFGRRWLSDYDYKLLFTTNDPASPCYPRPGNSVCDPAFKPIWAQRPDGRLIKFNYASSPAPGWYEDKPSPIAKILKSGSTYVLYSEDHTVEVYDAAGLPSSLQNRQGFGWTFRYNSGHYLTRVTHTSGRHVDFTWTDGRLTQVTDPAGHAYTYSYKTLPVSTSNIADPVSQPSTAAMVSAGDVGVHPMLLPPHDPRHDDPPPLPPTPPINSMVALLTGTVQPGAIPTRITYHYEDTRFPTALTGRTINDVRQSWIAYDANGRAAETKLAGNVERYQFSYVLDPNGNVQKTTVINPLNKSTTYSFDANGNDTGVEESKSTSCPLAVKAAHYDSNGYLDASTDFLGRVTTFDFDAKGQLQEQVENANATDASQRRVTSYTWDADNRMTKETVVGDHEISYFYSGAGDRLSSVTVKNLSGKVAASQGQTRTTTYTYATSPNGMVTSMVVDGPLTGSGDAITSTYSPTGDLLTVKNSLGQATTYDGYDNLGRPRFITGPNGDKAGYIYDVRGRLIEMQTYRNGVTQYTYYEYDGFGRLAKVTQPDGQYHGYQYDAAGRLVSEYEPEAGGTFAQTVYTYNAMSLPTSITTQRVFREPLRGTAP
ncbi:hypothetical protein ASG87_04910 [Frateuria sp. Soil773]|nr:hypothetical protein ASG87_04910 [Frateuria sp. Soil773]